MIQDLGHLEAPPISEATVGFATGAVLAGDAAAPEQVLA